MYNLLPLTCADLSSLGRSQLILRWCEVIQQPLHPCKYLWKENKYWHLPAGGTIIKGYIRIPCITNSYNEKNIIHLKACWTIHPFSLFTAQQTVQGPGSAASTVTGAVPAADGNASINKWSIVRGHRVAGLNDNERFTDPFSGRWAERWRGANGLTEAWWQQTGWSRGRWRGEGPKVVYKFGEKEPLMRSPTSTGGCSDGIKLVVFGFQGDDFSCIWLLPEEALWRFGEEIQRQGFTICNINEVTTRAQKYLALP